VGIQVVLGAMGINGDWPLVIAFAILAAYTYKSGLRAPALIALVKDTLIWITVLVAVIYIPSKVGGFDNIFSAAGKALPQKATPGALIPGKTDAQVAYATLALAWALVPAAVRSIAAAVLFTPNVWREYVRPGIGPAQEARVARLTSLIVKVGALLFIILAPVKYAIDFQLLGGVWISQTIPSIVVGL